MIELENLLHKLSELQLPPREKTFFDVGGRGYYENPASDLIAFFLSSREDHGLGKLVLESLLGAAGMSASDVDSMGWIGREVSTADGKRIDILVQGQEDILLIENKIRHWVGNPLESYVAHLEMLAPGKRQHFLVLSPRAENVPSPWKAVRYSDFFKCIRRGLEGALLERPFSKWVVLLNEFMLSIEAECEKSAMEENRFHFANANYSLLKEAQKMANDYVKEVACRAEAIVVAASGGLGVKIESRIEDRAEWQALRLYSSAWVGQSNIALLLLNNGRYRIQFYVYGVDDKDLKGLREFMVSRGLKSFHVETEQRTIRMFGHFECSDLESALREVDADARRLNAYFQQIAVATG